MSNKIIEVQVLPGGFMPSKKNASDAGFDLIATSDIRIEPGQVLKHALNIRLKLPEGTYGEITGKSGLGSKGLLVYAGIIDQDYRGIPHVVFTNINNHTFPTYMIVKKGEKLAQMILHPFATDYEMVQVESVDLNTVRGEGGFGSTGA